MEQKSAEIRGEADAQVIQLTAEAYGRSPEFYEFMRRLEVLKMTLGEDTSLIMSTENDLFQMLKDPGKSALMAPGFQPSQVSLSGISPNTQASRMMLPVGFIAPCGSLSMPS